MINVYQKNSLTSYLLKRAFLFFVIFFTFLSCSDNGSNPENAPVDTVSKELTIFIVNDLHAQIDNFSKVKFIIDKEKESTNVLLTSSGDLFSGNPVVDNYSDKGYPMIDLMNKVGFDISVVGNHEFDYGEEILKKRLEQADFDWICANVDMGNTGVPQPLDYKTIVIDGLRITFLGLVETNGKEGATIPSTHPWRVKNFTFERPEQVVGRYNNLKESENADLLIALTHLGYNVSGFGLGDVQLAMQFPFFDMIIGGHSHQKINEKTNGIPIFQAGNNLNYLGKIILTVKDKKITSIDYNLINLNDYDNKETETEKTINSYNDLPYLDEVIGYSNNFHDRTNLGCFYTDALRESLQVDVSFQNTGGIRANLDFGDITNREIYEISPFNNGTVIYEMTVLEIKNFLKESGSGFYYSGIQIEQFSNTVEIKDLNDKILHDETVLTVGLNDYIPAVHERFFPHSGTIQPKTDAEAIIFYLKNINSEVDYVNCNRYFRFN